MNLHPDSQGKVPVTAVVLAAGLGRRMGASNKLLLPYQGQSMLRHIVNQALASLCHRVVVVLGHQPDVVRRALVGLPVDFVDNPHFSEGMAASVRVAAHMTPLDSPVLIMLGDMPQVDTGVINALVKAYDAAAGLDPSLAATQFFQPVFEGQPGNPVLWGASWRSALQAVQGDEGARRVIKANLPARVLVAVDHAGVLRDVDQPDDLAPMGMSPLL